MRLWYAFFTCFCESLRPDDPYHLRQAHQRERQRIQEHAQVVQNAVRTREPETGVELESEVEHAVKEQNREADDQRDQSERGNGHQKTRREWEGERSRGILQETEDQTNHCQQGLEQRSLQRGRIRGNGQAVQKIGHDDLVLIQDYIGIPSCP